MDSPTASWACMNGFVSLEPGFGNTLGGMRLLLITTVVLVVLTGCAGYRKTLEDCHSFARARNYESALSSLDSSSMARSRRNRLLYLMEKGLLLHLKGEYRESNQILKEADRLADELFTRSLSAESLSFLTNDNIIPYIGEDYESAYLNYYKALNYLAVGELEDARVECRKVDEKLNYFTDSYEGRNVFKESAFLRFLTGLIYEAQGEVNDAFIAYRKSLQSYRYYHEKYGVSAPAALWSRLIASALQMGFNQEYQRYLEQARQANIKIEAGNTLIVALVDSGFVPVKKEAHIVVPTRHGFPVKLAVPEFEARPRLGGKVEISIDDGNWIVPEVVENVGAVARQSLADKKGRVMAKAVARAVAKQLAARQAEKEFGAFAGLTAQIAALLTENADLRSWTSLPEVILMGIIPVEPGVRSVNVRMGGYKETYSVNVKEGSVAFVSARAF